MSDSWPLDKRWRGLGLWIVMCRARLGLKARARAWARLWRLGLDEIESPALGEGSGPARLGLGLSPGLWTIEYLKIGDETWDVAICTH